MAKQLQFLQPIAWSLDHFSNVASQVQVLKMPPQFQQILFSLPAKPRDKAPPIRSLHDALGAASHSIIAFAPEVYKNDDKYPNWLYTTSDTQLDTHRLRVLFNHWLQVIGASEKRLAKHENLHFVWETIDLSQADDGLRRMLIPNLLVRWLIANQPVLSLAGRQHSLRLVPLMNRRYVAELVSEPIIEGNESFALVMRFWLASIPGQAESVLMHKTGIRRWANRRPWIEQGHSKSVYLRRASGYLDKAPRVDVFTRLTVRWFGRFDYVGKQADLFKLLSLEGELPDAHDLIDDPAQFQQQVLIPIETRDASSSMVQAGLEPSDHREIFNQLTQFFEGIAQPLLHLERVKAGNNKRAGSTIIVDDSFAGLSRIPYTLHIEIHSERHFDQLVRHILEIIGVPEQKISGPTVQITDSQGRVRLRIEQVRDIRLTDMLESNNKTDERRVYIRQNYPQTSAPIGMLIELKDYRQTKLRKRDPKHVIREEMTRSGRMTQFFQPEADRPNDIKYRLRQSAADLMRMLGYRHQPYYTYHSARPLPEKLDLMAFWVFQLNKKSGQNRTVYLPVVADVPYGHPHLNVIVPSASGRSARYDTLANGICAMANWSGDFENPDDIIRFFHATVEERNSTNPTLLMLVDANLRRIFPELNDTSNTDLSLYGMLDERPHIRVARLRFSDDDEAPFCVPPEPKSKYQGLYAHPGSNAFYSLQNVGERYVNSRQRKLDDPDRASINPATVLIQLFNQQVGDVATEWAGVVHRLRKASSHTSIATKLPQPLHDLESVRKYIPRYQSTTIDEDLNALGEEESSP